MKEENPIRILFVEDLPSDMELAERELRKEEIQFTSIRVETKEEFMKALEEFRPDLIISDYALPEFDGMQALKLTKKYDATIPFVVLTGSMNEDTAVACMKAGATDYVIKERMTRLPFAVQEAIEQKKARLVKAEAEEELKREKAYFEQLFEGAPEAIVIGDIKGRILHVNAEFTRLFGHTQEEAAGRLIDELIVPEDIQNEAVFITNRAAKGQRIALETVRQNKDGRTFNVSLLCQPIITDNKMVGVYGIYRDITKRKNAEEEIKNRIKELEEFYQMAVGRELRMKELKDQMEDMKEEMERLKARA